MSLSEKQREGLQEILGGEMAASIEAQGEELTKDLEGTVAFKEVEEEAEVEVVEEVKEEEVAYSLKTTIYRVLQEALNNVAKHSRANRVGLSLRRTGEGVELAVQDNGVGFDRREEFHAATSRRGLGIASMRERIELSGGSFTIESSPGQGTVVRAWWANERMSTNA